MLPLSSSARCGRNRLCMGRAVRAGIILGARIICCRRQCWLRGDSRWAFILQKMECRGSGLEWRVGAGWRRCRRGGVCIACRRVCKRLRTFGCRSGLHLLRAAAVLAVVEAVVVLVAADAARILGRASADSGEVAVPRLGAVCAPEHRPEGGRGRSRFALLGSLTLRGAAVRLFSHMAMGRGVGVGDVTVPSEHDADSNRSGERIGERISEVPTVGKSPPVECGRNRRRRRQRARRKFFRWKGVEVEESDVRNRITRLEAQMGAQWRVLVQQGGAALLGQRVQEETSRERVRQERVTELERNVQELAGSVESLWAAQQALVREIAAAAAGCVAGCVAGGVVRIETLPAAARPNTVRFATRALILPKDPRSKPRSTSTASPAEASATVGPGMTLPRSPMPPLGPVHGPPASGGTMNRPSADASRVVEEVVLQHYQMEKVEREKMYLLAHFTGDMAHRL